MDKKNKLYLLFIIWGVSTFGYTNPIVVEGAVSSDTDKQAILAKLRSVYGDQQVVDQLKVQPVIAPIGWTQSVNDLVTSDLKKVNQGHLTIRGTDVDLSGKVSSSHDLKQVEDSLKTTIHSPYQLNSHISIHQNEQKIVDNALKNRIVEFQSGSAILTNEGKKILNEMAVALNKVQGKEVKIIGYTDASGDVQKNIRLSQERAEAVKLYLVEQKIASERLKTQGLGAQNPVADNSTLDGRRKNRRIEFEVL